jgi:hypothetical protein
MSSPTRRKRGKNSMKSSTTQTRFRKSGLGFIAVSSVLFLVTPFMSNGSAQAQEQRAAVTPIVKGANSDWLAKGRPYDYQEKLLIQHETQLPSGEWSDADHPGQITPSIDSLVDQTTGQLERINPTTGATNGPATVSNEIGAYLSGTTAKFRVRVYNRRALNATDITVDSYTETGILSHCSANGTIAAPAESYFEYECELPNVSTKTLNTPIDIISWITVLGKDAAGTVRFSGPEPAAINVFQAAGTISTRSRQARDDLPFQDSDVIEAGALVSPGADVEFDITAANTGEVNLEGARIATNGGCEIELGTLVPGAQVVVSRRGVVVTGDPAAATRLAGANATPGCLVSQPQTGGVLTASLIANGRLGERTTPVSVSNPAYFGIKGQANTTTTAPAATTTAPAATTTAPAATTTAPAATTTRPAAPTPVVPVVTAVPVVTTAQPVATAAATPAPAPTTTTPAATVAGAVVTTAAPATAPATVLGTVFENAPEGDLAITGSTSDSLIMVSFGLLLLGGALVLMSMSPLLGMRKQK